MAFLFPTSLPIDGLYLGCSHVCMISTMIGVRLPVVPHKAVAEVSKIGNLQERLVVVNQGWQSESTDGPKRA